MLYVYVLVFNTFMTSYFFLKFFVLSRLLGLSASFFKIVTNLQKSV